MTQNVFFDYYSVYKHFNVFYGVILFSRIFGPQCLGVSFHSLIKSFQKQHDLANAEITVNTFTYYNE